MEIRREPIADRPVAPKVTWMAMGVRPRSSVTLPLTSNQCVFAECLLLESLCVSVHFNLRYDSGCGLSDIALQMRLGREGRVGREAPRGQFLWGVKESWREVVPARARSRRGPPKDRPSLRDLFLPPVFAVVSAKRVSVSQS